MHYMELGGAESALLGLLQSVDPSRVDVDVFIYDHRGELMKYIPTDKVRVLPEMKEYKMIERPFMECVKAGQFGVALGRWLAGQTVDKSSIPEGKHGLAVVAEDEKVVGVITDGDVRRAMQRDRNRFFEMKVGEIMNSAPKTIQYTDRLSKAEKIMQDYKIYALIVVDEVGKVKGEIDSISCL